MPETVSSWPATGATAIAEELEAEFDAAPGNAFPTNSEKTCSKGLGITVAVVAAVAGFASDAKVGEVVGIAMVAEVSGVVGVTVIVEVAEVCGVAEIVGVGTDVFRVAEFAEFAEFAEVVWVAGIAG